MKEGVLSKRNLKKLQIKDTSSYKQRHFRHMMPNLFSKILFFACILVKVTTDENSHIFYHITIRYLSKGWNSRKTLLLILSFRIVWDIGNLIFIMMFKYHLGDILGKEWFLQWRFHECFLCTIINALSFATELWSCK